MSFINSLGALLQETLEVLGTMSPLARINKLVQLGLEGMLSELYVVGYDDEGEPLFQGPWEYTNVNEDETYVFLHFDCMVLQEGDCSYVKYYDKREPKNKIGGAMFENDYRVKAGSELDHVQPIMLKG